MVHLQSVEESLGHGALEECEHLPADDALVADNLVGTELHEEVARGGARGGGTRRGHEEGAHIRGRGCEKV